MISGSNGSQAEGWVERAGAHAAHACAGLHRLGRAPRTAAAHVDSGARDSGRERCARLDESSSSCIRHRGGKKYHPNVNAMNYGRGSPIWRETMRCLHGRISTDTLWITSWEAPRGERAFAAAVTGECDDSDNSVGSWHTHPWKADSLEHPIKTRGLSVGDLRAFRASSDRISLAQWDRDSITGAVRAFNGSMQYPIAVQCRASRRPRQLALASGFRRNALNLASEM